MLFDLRTCDSAYRSFLEFMKMTPDEFLKELDVEADHNYDIFWARQIEVVKRIDISDLRIAAFHVVGSLDDCREILSTGLINLQEVLGRETILHQMLEEAGVCFNISDRVVVYDGTVYNIDYCQLANKRCHNALEENLFHLSYRVYCDYGVNGFIVNDDVYCYGSYIHERPEILQVLGALFPRAQKIEEIWRHNSKSYKIHFFATINQIDDLTFDRNRAGEAEDVFSDEEDYSMKIKKWLFFNALLRADNDSGEVYMFVRKNSCIPPNQFIRIEEM